MGGGPEQRRRALRPGAGAPGAARAGGARDRRRSGWRRRRGRWAARGRRWSGPRRSSPARCLEDGGAGDLLLDPAPFGEGAEEVRLRLLAGALCWVSGAVYRPRLLRLEAALAAVEGARIGHGLTLHGCVLRTRGGRIAIRRELARMAGAAPLAAGRWDGRWQIEGDAAGRRRPDDWRAGGRGPGALRRAPSRDRRARPWRRRRRSGARVSSSRRRWRAPEAGFGFRRVSAVPPPWEAEDARI